MNLGRKNSPLASLVSELEKSVRREGPRPRKLSEEFRIWGGSANGLIRRHGIPWVVAMPTNHLATVPCDSCDLEAREGELDHRRSEQIKAPM